MCTKFPKTDTFCQKMKLSNISVHTCIGTSFFAPQCLNTRMPEEIHVIQFVTGSTGSDFVMVLSVEKNYFHHSLLPRKP